MTAETPTGTDIIASQFKGGSIGELRLDRKTLETFLDIKEVGEEDISHFQQVLNSRTEELTKNPREHVLQAVRTNLFEKGDAGTLDRLSRGIPQYNAENPEESMENRVAYLVEVADIVFGLKTRLVKAGFGGGGRRGRVSLDEEQLKNVGEEMLTRIAELNPDVAAGLAGGGDFKGMNFASMDYTWEQAVEAADDYEKKVNEYVPFWLPSGLDPHVYGRLYSGLEQGYLTEATIETAKKVQHWQFMVKILTANGALAQVARLAPGAYAGLGIHGATYVGLLPAAMHFVTDYFETSAKSTEEAADRINEHSPEGEQLNALLSADRVSVVIEAGDKVGKVELGVARSLDILTGLRVGEAIKDNNGIPLYNYIYPEGHDLAGTSETGTMDEILGKVNGVREIDVKQGLSPQWSKKSGRAAMGEVLYSMTETRRNEVFKGWFVGDVMDQLSKQGIDLAKLTTFWATGSKGEILDTKSDRYQWRYKQEMALHRENSDFDGKMDEYEIAARKSAAGVLVNDLAIVEFGKMHSLALATADILGETWGWDPQQWFDHLSELWNKAVAGVAYNEKYGILPAEARKFVQSYLRGVIAWKRKDVDPVLIALYGNEKMAKAVWMNPLDSNQAPPIPSLKYLDDMSLLKALEAPDNENKDILPKGIKIKKNEKMVELPDGIEIKASELKDSVESTIMAVLYGKSNFRTSMGGQMRRANEIVAMMKVNPKEGLRLAKINLENFIAKFNKGMAPQEFPSNQTEAISKLEGLSDLRRSHLEIVNFKDLLGVMGYTKMDLHNDEYMGVRGLAKVIEARSSGHWLLGQVEKFFKYLSKYPGLAVAETRALNKLVPTLNNALNPLYEHLMGGKSGNFKLMNADQVGEAIAMGIVNLLFINKRTPEEAGKFVEQISEAMNEAAGLIGYMSGNEQRQDVSDLVMAAELFADRTMEAYEYKWTGGMGAHGSNRDYLQIKESDSDKEAEVVSTLRKAGYRVVYPNGNELEDYDLEDFAKRGLINPAWLLKNGSQKMIKERQKAIWKRLDELGYVRKRKPMVVWGALQPIFWVSGSIKKENKMDKWIPEKSVMDVLAQYGHRGKEALLTIMCLEVLCDQMKITHSDMITVLSKSETFNIGNDGMAPKKRVEAVWKKYLETKEKLLANEERRTKNENA